MNHLEFTKPYRPLKLADNTATRTGTEIPDIHAWKQKHISPYFYHVATLPCSQTLVI